MGTNLWKRKLEIWPQKPRYFSPTIAVHHRKGRQVWGGGVTSVCVCRWVTHQCRGWHFPGGYAIHFASLNCWAVRRPCEAMNVPLLLSLCQTLRPLFPATTVAGLKSKLNGLPRGLNLRWIVHLFLHDSPLLKFPRMQPSIRQPTSSLAQRWCSWKEDTCWTKSTGSSFPSWNFINLMLAMHLFVQNGVFHENISEPSQSLRKSWDWLLPMTFAFFFPLSHQTTRKLSLQKAAHFAETSRQDSTAGMGVGPCTTMTTKDNTMHWAAFSSPKKLASPYLSIRKSVLFPTSTIGMLKWEQRTSRVFHNVGVLPNARNT